MHIHTFPFALLYYILIPPIFKHILPYQQEIKRECNEHLISPDMATKESNLQRRFQVQRTADAQRLDS